MRREEVSESLEKLAFSFFYWHSRFEFALKEKGYLRDTRLGCRAAPDWCAFIEDHCEEYRISAEAKELIRAAPKRQVVGVGSCMEWRAVDLNKYSSELKQAVKLLQTVRNNLFHGGKHGDEGWDDPERTAKLLKLGVVVLHQLAEQSEIVGDYKRYY